MASVRSPFTFFGDSLTYKELFNWCCGSFDKEHVFVELSKDFNRKPANREFEGKVKEIWEAQVSKMPSLYNGSKFRFRDVVMEKHCLRIQIGLTWFKDFICTNMNEEDNDLLREWGRVHHSNPHACFADPIGVNGLVISRDDHVVFMRRSTEVYEAQGKLHTPGGHPEPNEIPMKQNGLEQKEPELQHMDPAMVVHEMFYSIVKEVRDEVNIPEESLSWPVLMGIVRNQEMSNGRPELCFLIRCSLTSEQIKASYDKGGPEAYESTEIILVDIKEFEDWKPSAKISRICNELTATAKACLHLYVNQKQCFHVKHT